MPCSRATLAAGCVGGVAVEALVAAAVAVGTAVGVAVLCAGPHAASRPPPAAAPNIASAFRRVIRYADESVDWSDTDERLPLPQLVTTLPVLRPLLGRLPGVARPM